MKKNNKTRENNKQPLDYMHTHKTTEICFLKKNNCEYINTKGKLLFVFVFRLLVANQMNHRVNFK